MNLDIQFSKMDQHSLVTLKEYLVRMINLIDSEFAMRDANFRYVGKDLAEHYNEYLRREEES